MCSVKFDIYNVLDWLSKLLSTWILLDFLLFFFCWPFNHFKKIYRSGMYFKIMMIMANKKYCYDYYRYTEHWYLYTLLRKHQCMLIHINPSNYRYFKFWYVWGNSSSNRVCTKVSFLFSFVFALIYFPFTV